MAMSLLTGVKEDVGQILYKFVNHRSYSFAVFTEIWKEMQFYYIYCGRPTVFEMKAFTRELLLLVKSHALPNNHIWERCGAIFLLFALYFVQPLIRRVTIRIEMDEWMSLLQFAEDMKAVNMDIPFCFYKLVVNQAFDFVFTNKPYNIESMKDDEVPRKDIQSRSQQKKQKYDKFAMGSLLTSIGFDPHVSAQREDKYNDLKSLLNHKFPELCNFDVRRFAVNLLVPQEDCEESLPSLQSSSSSGTKKRKRKKGKGRKKSIAAVDPLRIDSDDEAEMDLSTLSMPHLELSDT